MGEIKSLISEILELQKQGLTLEQIAEKTKLSVSIIEKTLANWNDKK